MKPTLLAVLVLIGLTSFAQNDPSFVYDPLEVSFKASFNQDLGHQMELKDNAAWQEFNEAHPSWSCYYNDRSSAPHRAFGPPISVAGTNAAERVFNFLESELGSFGIAAGDLIVQSQHSSSKYDYVNLVQQHQGLEVLGSRIIFKLHGSQVIMFGADYFAGIDLSLTPEVNTSEAEIIASAQMTNEILSVSVTPELKVLPIANSEVVHHLVYETMTKTISPDGIPANYRAFIDAQTGEILYRVNEVKHLNSCPKCKKGDKKKKKVLQMGMQTVQGTVKAELYANNIVNDTETLGLPHLELNIDGETVYTDVDGFFTSSADETVGASLSLQGLYVSVNTGDVVPTFSTTLVDGDNDVNFDNEANIKELSTYRATNLIHDHMKIFLPQFTALDGVMNANIDVEGQCNAFYDGDINFFDIGGGCNATSLLADVVYHEYGHGINGQFYNSLGANYNNGAMNEGYADVWAISLSENPHLGQGFFTDTEDGIRRYDIDPKVYPEDLVGQVHADGEIICGAWYDSHLLMGEDWNLTMTIFAEAYEGLQATGFNGNEGEIFVDVLLDALQADDDNGDITDGTPNDLAIIEGFAIHGINLLAAADIQHEDILAYQADETITIEAEINLEFPFNLYLDGARMYYKVNTGLWNETELVNVDGNDYEAEIPAQESGTVVGYYLGLLDNLGNLSGVLPSGANSADPTLPYFILVGVELVAEHDSDSNEDFGQWETGVAGDDATAGIWELNIPIGSFADPNIPESIVAPDHQHTPGIDGEFCFITGQSPSPQASQYDTDVDDGFTTVRSPVIDLSVYEAPVLSYWRWFAHVSAANPANIGWIVQLSDDGGTNWVDVESTVTEDREWRRNAIRIEDYVEINDEFRIQMIASDPIYVGSGSLVEAAVDDVYIWDLGSGVGLEPLSIRFGMDMYPNPASEVINVNYLLRSSNQGVLQIFDSNGKLVQTSTLAASDNHSQNRVIDVGALAGGLYQIRADFGDGNVFQQKLVIR